MKTIIAKYLYSKVSEEIYTEFVNLILASNDMYKALVRCNAALAANGAPNCEAAKEARLALLKAEGKEY